MRDGIWTRLRNSTLVAILVIGGITGDAAPTLAQDARGAAKLERGRVLEFELLTNIDSESAKVGDHLRLELAQPVKNSAGDNLLPAGWIVAAHVTKVHRAGKTNCRDGSVAWEFDAATAPDGTPVKLKLLLWRPVGPNGLLAEKVKTKTAGQKFETVLDDVVLAPAFIITLPIYIPLAIGEASGVTPCNGKPGEPARVRPGRGEYAVVTKDVQLSLTRIAMTNAPNPD